MWGFTALMMLTWRCRCGTFCASSRASTTRITGRSDAFSPASYKIHIDIDPTSINKIIRVDVPITSMLALRTPLKA